MKRSLLIAGGTLGGLGAVLAVTPPQFGSSENALALGAAPAGAPAAQPVAAATTASATPAATKAAVKSTPATKSATVKKATTATKAAAATTTQAAATTTTSATPTPAATKTTAAASSAKNGTFTGDAVNVGYGIVQVSITVANGKITDAQAVQAPSGRNDRWTQMSVPVLRQRTLAAQGSNISGVSGASYTSYGWYKSLVSALAKAGLN